MRKKAKSNPLNAEELHGALDGVRVFVVHCKDGNEVYDSPINHIITNRVRELVSVKQLGVSILAADQGMRIGAFQVILYTV
jgi:3',5'-cyclic-nucleotide phosphodiesterase